MWCTVGMQAEASRTLKSRVFVSARLASVPLGGGVERVTVGDDQLGALILEAFRLATKPK
jgi:hypothetical protein